MKTPFACAIALAVITAANGWADRAAAEEPFELSPTQLDSVVAGSHVTGSLVIDGREFTLVVNTPGVTHEQTLTFPATPTTANNLRQIGIALGRHSHPF